MQARDQYRRHRLLVVDYVLAIAIFAGYLTLLLSTMQMGFTRDEGYYFHAAWDYQAWFDEWEENRAADRGDLSFTQENIDRHWGYNPEHPVLMKTLFGLSWDYFGRPLEERVNLDLDLETDPEAVPPGRRIETTESTAMRLPAAVLSALLLALVFLFTREAFGSRGAAIFASLALGLMPRFFFHAHLACFDAPITSLWFLVVYSYWRSYHSKLWAVLTGVFWGIALIVKLNAFFIPIVLLMHWAATSGFGFEGRGWRFRIRIPKIPAAFVAMVFLGPIIFYLGWPRHWFDTFNRIVWYFGRHLNHEHYFVYYFGESLVRPPFPVSFPFVMTLITLPVVTLVTALVGSGVVFGGPIRQFRVSRHSGSDQRRAVNDPRRTGWLIGINLLFPILLIAKADTPVFGGTKHWMGSMPFLAMLSGIGAVWAFNLVWTKQQSRTQGLRTLALAVFLGFLVAPMAQATYSTHPNGTAYYNQLIGGIRGAADRHMMRQFWGYSSRQGLGWVNENFADHASFFPSNTNRDAIGWYKRDGLLRQDIRPSGDMGRSDYAFYNHQFAFLNWVLQPIWENMGTAAPIRVWGVNGVPTFNIYENQNRH